MSQPSHDTVQSTGEQLLAAYVGPGWRHYARTFARIRGEAPGAVWNWAAALVPFWLAYRRMLAAQVLACLAFPALWYAIAQGLSAAGVENYALFGDAVLAAWLVMALVLGAVGDRLVYRRARRAVGQLPGSDAADHETIALLRRLGGVSFLGAGIVAALSLTAVWLMFASLFAHRV